MSYIVTGPLAVAIYGGRRVTLEKGATLPAGADPARVAHLLDVGLIAEIPDPEPAPAVDSGEPPTNPDGGTAQVPTVEARPLTDLKVAELKALAAENGIDITGVTNKDDLIAVIADAIDAAPTAE